MLTKSGKIKKRHGADLCAIGLLLALLFVMFWVSPLDKFGIPIGVFSDVTSIVLVATIWVWVWIRWMDCGHQKRFIWNIIKTSILSTLIFVLAAMVVYQVRLAIGAVIVLLFDDQLR